MITPFKVGDKIQVKKGLNIMNGDTFELLSHNTTFIVTEICQLHPRFIVIKIDGQKFCYFAIHFFKEKTSGFIIE